MNEAPAAASKPAATTEPLYTKLTPFEKNFVYVMRQVGLNSQSKPVYEPTFPGPLSAEEKDMLDILGSAKERAKRAGGSKHSDDEGYRAPHPPIWSLLADDLEEYFETKTRTMWSTLRDNKMLVAGLAVGAPVLIATYMQMAKEETQHMRQGLARGRR